VSPGRSASALFAFLGLKPTGDRVNPAQGLRLHASIGTAVLLYFDEDHQVFAIYFYYFILTLFSCVQGWKSKISYYRRPGTLQELSVHVRAHFYMYSKDLRFLPTSDLEETFEFLSCVAQGVAIDDATKLVVLDALNTFVGEPDSVRNAYFSFANQKELDLHCGRHRR
jgi:hypothetical protein